eukprot:7225978-Pyramimonas_sp.AAC.1
MCESDTALAVAPYQPELLAVAKGNIRPQDAAGLVGKTARVCLNGPRRIALPAETEGPPPVRPHWDERLR